MKKGPPASAVTIPTGNSPVLSRTAVRQKVSAVARKQAPMNPAVIMRQR